MGGSIRERALTRSLSPKIHSHSLLGSRTPRPRGGCMAAEPPAKRSSSLNEAAAAARKQLSPKYVQLRGDQQIELDVLARELQAARTRKAERITANTVIRVAVDVLLKRRGVLVGDTEAELLSSFLAYIEDLEQRPAQSKEDPTGS